MRRVIRAIVRHNAPRLRKRALVETQLAGYEAWFSDETKFRAFAEMLSGDDKKGHENNFLIGIMH